MLKILKIICLTIFLFSFLAIKPVLAEEKQNFYFFYGNGCPHCAKEEKFLDKIEADYKNIAVKRYEIWHNLDNAKLFKEVAQKTGLHITGVPVLIIGDEIVTGYHSDETTGAEILSIIDRLETKECVDLVAPIADKESQIGICKHSCEQNDTKCIHDCGCGADIKDDTDSAKTISIPIFGPIEIKNLSLPALTFLIAALDGFNPCAMWVLLFLISLLLGIENRTKMWILGTAFVVTSGLVYFIFLAAWLNLFLFIGFIFWIRLIVGLVALGSGGYHLRDYWKNRDGQCKVTSSEKRKRVFDKLKRIVQEKNFWLAIVGIILLAAAVNLVELVCSAGLPAVYTQVLSLSNLAAWQYYLYLALYILIFMLDDLLIFVIAMTTLRIKAVSTRFIRWSGLVGGIIMLIIGILLLFRPGWLMF